MRGRADGDAKSREICQDLGDYVTMHLFEDLLKDEEGHINFLEMQLQLLASIGDEGYGLLNAASANDAE
ncbi:bacterioferritin [Mesorhizobium alhagi CCNWXJ12-2]|uniref:Bacterioferritin n=1 Tax=Mesorhizobium alhagi CCNWXJ12-2 TaxID=1107882 RepID=H0I458_9HYPH|nr:bacterioferritin [Mesorhizobium alhagi CCNWXJ12-2]